MKLYWKDKDFDFINVRYYKDDKEKTFCEKRDA